MSNSDLSEKEVFQPIEPAELLRNLKLATGKAAQFTGVSRRQLCYWTDTGIVPSFEDDSEDAAGDESARRAYDFEALHRVLLINQTLKHFPGLRKAAKEVDLHLTNKRKRDEELASSIEQKRESFLTEQADKLEALSKRIKELTPKLMDRPQLLEMYRGLVWLEQLADRVLAGELLLEEDAQACLRLATLLEQGEAKVEHLSLQTRGSTVARGSSK
jgi:DNA-binding transcriptional MerR regulator